VNNELRRTHKEAVVAYFNVLPYYLSERTGKPRNIQVSLPDNRDLNPGCSEYVSRMLAAQP
jgi:hypothetical protein